MILAGDIGGTNTRLAIFDENHRVMGKVYQFRTGDGSNLIPQMRSVLNSATDKPTRACLAMAGPIIDGVCDSNNIKRKFYAHEIQKETRLASLTMINDLVANAAGIESLSRSEMVTILKGEKHDGNCAIVSPGTGLGEGALIWDGKHHRPIPSEGGHARYAPTTELEQDLLDYLMPEKGTVVYEDVCSGQGIEPLFRFFVDRGSVASASFIKKIDKQKDPGKRVAMISTAGLDRTEPAAIDAMQLFVRTLGIEAGNMAAKVFATGGVYLGGGIPPKILPLLRSKTFKQAFLNHRTLGGFFARFPVRVILNTDTALEGAAIYCARFGD